ncbi:sialidase family protein [Sphingobacterium wenxiniae]|uniref:exo-alpha-sialidase n=1 Tax=Sphingobacterium wenxiniae TaxID=683125 RepID=A0A1I6UKY9_9SPHI|nr:sialidase family protein [Sphingobacterium wenxiniae]SFT01957.1 sialidase-1 [Sphingobacterium wenxiniae]
MKKLLLFITVITSLLLHAQEVTVFKSGDDGYASYRIPAIIKNKAGELIAFAEGRVDHAGDYGNVDLVYKISKDKGKTWGKLQIAADYDQLQAGNAAPVVDLLDPKYPQGRIFLFYNTGNDHEHEVRAGKGLREVWYITSTDGANTWSEPINITAQVHRPNQPASDPTYTFAEDWRAYANTPGHALQFDSGKYKGRLYIPANHSSGNPKEAGKDYFAHAYYSDNHGQSFHLSDKITFEGGNETMAAQISDTELYMNTRNQQGNVRNRIVSYSSDGGATWDTTFYDRNLPDPINQGSTLSWKKGKKYILAVCNASDEKNRDNLTLRLSKDKGKTWYYNKTIAKAPDGYKGAYAAYSDIVLMKKNRVGILYEKDNYETIVFTVEKVR